LETSCENEYVWVDAARGSAAKAARSAGSGEEAVVRLSVARELSICARFPREILRKLKPRNRSHSENADHAGRGSNGHSTLFLLVKGLGWRGPP